MLQTLETCFLSLFSHHCDAFLLYDMNGDIVAQNDAAARLRRISAWDMILHESVQSSAFVDAYNGMHRALEFSLASAEGQLNIRLDLAPIVVNDQITGISAIARDVRVTFAPADVAESESLLPSMPILYDRMVRLLSAMRRDGRAFALHVVTIVPESSIAEGMAGPIEHTVLARLIETVRGTDTVARMGRNFIIVQAEFADNDGVNSLVERLFATLAEPIQASGLSVTMKTRIGTAIATRRTLSVDDLLSEADLALASHSLAGLPVSYVEGA